MKHQWEELPATVAKVCKLGWETVRVCSVCGRAQRRETQHLWMRVTGYRWEPLVGRCPGKHDPNELGEKAAKFQAIVAKMEDAPMTPVESQMGAVQ